MARIHLFEIEDQSWCPRPVRDAATDYLRFAINTANSYAPALPHLLNGLKSSNSRTIVDLCSGGSGPWLKLLAPIAAEVPEVEVTLTDLYPNLEAFHRAQEETGGRLQFERESVDATAVPKRLHGFRTIFTAFHHFRPEQGRAIIADAVQSRQGIAVFEATERSAINILMILFTPLLLLFISPLIRPFTLSRILFTYIIPLVPIVVLWDGVISCLRTYSPKELRELVATVPGNEGYTWEIGQERGAKGPIPVTYLVGVPLAEDSTKTAF